LKPILKQRGGSIEKKEKKFRYEERKCLNSPENPGVSFPGSPPLILDQGKSGRDHPGGDEAVSVSGDLRSLIGYSIKTQADGVEEAMCFSPALETW